MTIMFNGTVLMMHTMTKKDMEFYANVVHAGKVWRGEA